MIDISNKYKTLRIAKAQSLIYTTPEVINKIKNCKVEKGDVLETAKIAAITAGKKTWELIPHCHQIPIDTIKIEYEIYRDYIKIISTAIAIWKTGVEMEALTSVSVAALTIYDMIKPYKESCEIKEIKLIEKKGGKSDFAKDLKIKLKVAVIVCSDSIYNGKRKDKSGFLIKETLSQYKNIKIKRYGIFPNDKEIIKNSVLNLVKQDVDLVFTTGGTGLGPKDITVEAIKEIIEKEVMGISEAMRNFGQERTPYSMLSRGICGVLKNTLIITLPGSLKGVKESLSAILPGVFHAFYMMQGGGH